MDTVQLILFNALNGFTWGLIIALVAIGLALVFGLVEIVNVAHGALFMLGAVIGWYICQATSSFWLALFAAPLLVGGLGLLIERVTLRRIEDEPIKTIMVTFGVMLIFEQVALAVFGGAPQRIAPAFQQWIPVFGFMYPFYRVFVALMALATIGGLWLFLYLTKYGRWMRAARQDREMATAIGIPVDKVYMYTYGLGAALAAMAGVLMGPIITVEYEMGLKILIPAFIVAIVGGLGSLEGAVLASILIGELEGISAVFINPTGARVLSLVFMIFVLMVRPYGLFSKP
jgi:branched-chain amino acid transport system permease protein